MIGPWVIDSIHFYRDLRTGTQYIGNWASRESKTYPGLSLAACTARDKLNQLTFSRIHSRPFALLSTIHEMSCIHFLGKGL